MIIYSYLAFLSETRPVDGRCAALPLLELAHEGGQVQIAALGADILQQAVRVPEQLLCPLKAQGGDVLGQVLAGVVLEKVAQVGDGHIEVVGGGLDREVLLAEMASDIVEQAL